MLKNKKTWIALACCVLFLGMVIYAAMSRPDVTDAVLIRVDILGISDASKAEKARVYRINELGLPVEKRLALLQRTVFIDATTEMVFLALGAPNDPNGGMLTLEEAKTKFGSGVSRWVYFFHEERRPTILEFHNGVLAVACRGSAATVNSANPCDGAITPASR